MDAKIDKQIILIRNFRHRNMALLHEQLIIIRHITRLIPSSYTLPIAQIHQNFMYIEKLPTIGPNEIFADTKWIYATYRIFGFSFKSWPRQMRLLENEKGKSIGLDSPL